jgi:hypothetical protein
METGLFYGFPGLAPWATLFRPWSGLVPGNSCSHIFLKISSPVPMQWFLGKANSTEVGSTIEQRDI